MSTLIQAAEAYATALQADNGPRATTDPAWALNNRPCILIAPPLLDFTTLQGAAEVEWRLIALSSYEAGDIAALTEIQTMIAAAELRVGLTGARPIQYTLTRDRTRIAAYELTTVPDHLAF